MELVLLSTLVSKTFRQRTTELFFGHHEAFENKEEKTLDAARSAGKAAAMALRKHAKKAADSVTEEEKEEHFEAEDSEEAGEEAGEEGPEKLELPEQSEKQDKQEVVAKEPFESKETPNPMTQAQKIMLIVFLVISVGLGAYAAYLSWKANTVFEFSTPVKVFFSFFAFIGGISYLSSYLIFRWKETEYVVKMKGGPLSDKLDAGAGTVGAAVGAVGLADVAANAADAADGEAAEIPSLDKSSVDAEPDAEPDAAPDAELDVDSDGFVISPTETFETPETVGGRGRGRRHRMHRAAKAAKSPKKINKARKSLWAL